ncbi:MAG: class I SAM-dependent methyltransferase [Halothiobacillaceae bacterium]
MARQDGPGSRRKRGSTPSKPPCQNNFSGRPNSAPGDRVLDIGCGAGTTTLEIARRIGAAGHAIGLDISEQLLAVARERAANDARIAFVHGDATVHPFEPAASDWLLSRNGVMFFADPVASFTNMRQGLRPGGRLAFGCWRAAKLNEWITVPLEAARKALPPGLPPPPADPEAPGPYSFSDESRVARILAGAGFLDIEVRPIDVELDAAADGGLEGAAEFLQLVGPTSRFMAHHGEAVRAVARDNIRAALAPYARNGTVLLGGAIWIVTAGNPSAPDVGSATTSVLG